MDAAVAMHARQTKVNDRWRDEGLPVFGLGIGITTGAVAAALLGSEEHLEYTLVGDTVNLAQRLQQWAEPARRSWPTRPTGRWPTRRRPRNCRLLRQGPGHARVRLAGRPLQR